VDGDSLRVLVSGIRGSAPGDPFDGAIHVLATRGADGRIVVTWATAAGLFVHTGVIGSGDDQPLSTGSCCTYEPAASW
jgi:hypothetical protein